MVLRVPQVMLARAVGSLPEGPYGFEAKWDGFRCLAVRAAGAQTRLLSRNGTDLTQPFADIAAAADRDLPDDQDVILDGELVVFHEGKLAFDRLQRRMNRRAGAVAREIAEAPAHFVVFDLLGFGRDLTTLPYQQRRRRLEEMFSELKLGPPWTLCPITLDRAQAEEWITQWAVAGIEGVVAKPLSQPYRAGQRGWLKVRSRSTSEGVVGAITGTLLRPSSVLLGRFDDVDRLRYIGRSTPVTADVRQALVDQLMPASGDHPWTGAVFSAAWGRTEPLDTTLVQPVLVAEFSGDTAIDSGGRWRHLVRILRIRTDMQVSEVPRFGDTSGLR
jgi:ATP-dependent DNA ligase